MWCAIVRDESLSDEDVLYAIDYVVRLSDMLVMKLDWIDSTNLYNQIDWWHTQVTGLPSQDTYTIRDLYYEIFRMAFDENNIRLLHLMTRTPSELLLAIFANQGISIRGSVIDVIISKSRFQTIEELFETYEDVALTRLQYILNNPETIDITQ
jgi:hypothetical protein